MGGHEVSAPDIAAWLTCRAGSLALLSPTGAAAVSVLTPAQSALSMAYLAASLCKDYRGSMQGLSRNSVRSLGIMLQPRIDAAADL